MSKKLFIALAAGIFFGAALFDIFPEARERFGAPVALAWFLVGILAWIAQKKILRALRKPDFAPLVATALWLHSVLEGILTGLAFGVSRAFGVVVLLGMVLHLLPEFFGALTLLRGAGVRVHASVLVPLAGFLILFLSFGATYYWLPSFGVNLNRLVALSGGAFLYIGVVSFFRTHPFRERAILSFVAFILGNAIAFAAVRFF